MAAEITPPSPASIEPVRLPAGERGGPVAAGGAFHTLFAEAVARVENYRREADTAVDRFLRGEDEEVHKVAMAAQQAELSLELFLQVKNKVVQAYQEIMRMQI